MTERLKLSEAIRRGIEQRGETAQAYYSTPNRCSDAIGAALEGAGIVNPAVMTCAWLDNFGFDEARALLIKYWGNDSIESIVPCPVAGCQFVDELHDTIDHLTDIHTYSRTSIAEWLEGHGY